jgi:hypothetical protein
VTLKLNDGQANTGKQVEYCPFPDRPAARVKESIVSDNGEISDQHRSDKAPHRS